MNINILVFNILFYFVTLLLYYNGKQDPSSSLGYGFLIVAFWGVSLLVLLILLSKKVIQPKTILDKVGVVTATPLVCLIIVGVMMASNETPVSTRYFDKDHHRYKVYSYDFNGSAKTKRVEYFKSIDTVNPDDPFVHLDKWLKDSTWVHYSEAGDTLKVEVYKDDLQIK
jgi:glucan phosphoethanolaminetransferase (alkaline phosphatase superfamily)